MVVIGVTVLFLVLGIFFVGMLGKMERREEYEKQQQKEKEKKNLITTLTTIETTLTTIEAPTEQERKWILEYRRMKNYSYSESDYEYYIREHYGTEEAKYLAICSWQHKIDKFKKDNFGSVQRFEDVSKYIELESKYIKLELEILKSNF